MVVDIIVILLQLNNLHKTVGMEIKNSFSFFL
jgi:hypothetical protein